MTTTTSAIIAKLNDDARKGKAPCTRMLTAGIGALDRYTRSIILAKVRNFSEFHKGNDPHGEHDCGKIEHEGCKVFWKMDYYDAAMQYGSENPADPNVTTRVLTVMLAEEY